MEAIGWNKWNKCSINFFFENIFLKLSFNFFYVGIILRLLQVLSLQKIVNGKKECLSIHFLLAFAEIIAIIGTPSAFKSHIKPNVRYIEL